VLVLLIIFDFFHCIEHTKERVQSRFELLKVGVAAFGLQVATGLSLALRKCVLKQQGVDQRVQKWIVDCCLVLCFIQLGLYLRDFLSELFFAFCKCIRPALTFFKLQYLFNLAYHGFLFFYFFLESVRFLCVLRLFFIELLYLLLLNLFDFFVLLVNYSLQLALFLLVFLLQGFDLLLVLKLQSLQSFFVLSDALDLFLECFDFALKLNLVVLPLCRFRIVLGLKTSLFTFEACVANY
jgi:hypothetical protein